MSSSLEGGEALWIALTERMTWKENYGTLETK